MIPWSPPRNMQRAWTYACVSMAGKINTQQKGYKLRDDSQVQKKWQQCNVSNNWNKISKLEAHESFRLGSIKVMYSHQEQVVFLLGKLLFVLACLIRQAPWHANQSQDFLVTKVKVGLSLCLSPMAQQAGAYSGPSPCLDGMPVTPLAFNLPIPILYPFIHLGGERHKNTT